MSWLSDLQHFESEGVPCVLVTLTALRGHAPREPGAKMVVTADEVRGTVGGGNLEMTAVEWARALLAAGAEQPGTLTLRLTPDAPARHGRQCCGGEVTLLLEPLNPPGPQVAIFGLGHVGLAAARLLSRLPLGLHLHDSRAAQLTPERLAEVQSGAARVTVRHTPLPELALAGLPAGTHVLILTHDHAEDAVLCDAALRRPDLGSTGLIGSGSKWRHFQGVLASEGHAPADIARVRCPIGLPGLGLGAGERGRKTPEVIAIGVVAELLGLIGGARAGVAADAGAMQTGRVQNETPDA